MLYIPRFCGRFLLTAILQYQEVPPSEESKEQLNSIVFEEHKSRPWSDIHAESERIYAEHIKLIEQLSELEFASEAIFPSVNGCAAHSWPQNLLCLDLIYHLVANCCE